MYDGDNNLTSDVYSHGNLKTDSGNELAQRAQQAQGNVDEEPRVKPRGSEESVATRVPGPWRNQMPPALHEHTLKHDARQNRKCMVCGTLTHSICGCGGQFVVLQQVLLAGHGIQRTCAVGKLMSAKSSGGMASDHGSEHRNFMRYLMVCSSAHGIWFAGWILEVTGMRPSSGGRSCLT
jgi:hypothetical protein